jgi:hypothetical protein
MLIIDLWDKASNVTVKGDAAGAIFVIGAFGAFCVFSGLVSIMEPHVYKGRMNKESKINGSKEKLSNVWDNRAGGTACI